ncbi:carboxypeptidase-like regulatory domain-containing protein [Nodularia harveyana UHCC-0300]|uniref:Carboxypeptidase-like regulatory domain-containing protein n=1 Tax=Nodularia harveyana UHCC-0300 TaxID=2974287 RepID=A0ABU5UJY4_9CYAN|nr:carboxypeptidase-like regulatory domain-containing protein [Nodularia harveyana]MEA5583593.1 carboxypeptidase-like regulatory domain-containing protein [Nodularia harveyana UHCC-0300]
MIFHLINPGIVNCCPQNTFNTTTNYTISQVNDSPISPQTEEKKSDFVILPLGINIGRRNVLQSSFVRGYEDGEKAVNFDDWLISWRDLTKALNLNVTTLPDGELELRGVGLIKRINPNELITDPELGLVISIAKIYELLEVTAEFDIAAYAIIFEPPWLNLQEQKNRTAEIPVVLEGLPVVNAPDFTLSTIGQQINISGRENSNQLTSQGNFTTIGTILGGSWYSRINQPDLLDNTTWQLQEGQYLRQGDFNDYVIGSQPSFWQNQGRGDYWGFTAIRRFGFKADNLDGGGFTPSQRLQSNTINRIIEGTAAPGTLVQLVSGNDRRIFAEVLVDSSGVYRFENVPITGIGLNYRILLYPNGQLASIPIEQEAIFLNLPGQLTKGTSSLIVSSGLSRETRINDLFGNFTDVRGGIAYRHGVSDSLTLGAGIVYDRDLLGLVDIFYQPNNFPFKLAVSALQTPENFKYNANLEFRPTPKLNFNLSGNEVFQSFNFNWSAAPGININSTGNNSSNIINTGINFSRNFGNLFTFSSLKIDNRRQLDLSSNVRWRKWNLSTRSNPTNTALGLIYDGSIFNLPGNESLNLGYETTNSNNLTNDLVSLKWKYQSPYRLSDRRSIWDFDLGYGIGSQGSGFLAAVSTVVIPGLSLRLRYDGVSTTSDVAAFRIELGSAVNFSPSFSPGDTRFERLRSEGGIFIQPFLDKNNNGIRDNNEKIYTEDIELLLILNNKKFNPSFSNITKQGVLLKLAPGIYRIDLDPAGYPIDWKPAEVAAAIEVVSGSYTTFSIPFVASYTLAGTLTDSEGNPIAGAKVEAINSDNNSSVISITNSAGIFYLEQLPLGTYQLQVNGKSAEPQTIRINPDAETLQELNLKLPF